jgi:hypothetical protein
MENNNERSGCGAFLLRKDAFGQPRLCTRNIVTQRARQERNASQQTKFFTNVLYKTPSSRTT